MLRMRRTASGLLGKLREVQDMGRSRCHHAEEQTDRRKNPRIDLESEGQMKEKKLYVVIKDGNRTVGWDYFGDTTIRTVLANKFFTWEPDTVKVHGEFLKDSELDAKLDQFAVNGKVRITMQRPKKKEEEAVENVG